MMVLDASQQNHVVGLVTTRDLLRIMAASLKQGHEPNTFMENPIGDHMTPISQVIFGRPEETIGMARTLMAKLRIKCLPVLSKDGQVEGLITARDMSDFGLSAKERGGKAAYLKDVSDRVGIKNNTSMAEPPTYLKAHLALEQQPLFMNIGQAALPHPFKQPEGMGGNRRGTHEFKTNRSLTQSSMNHGYSPPKLIALDCYSSSDWNTQNITNDISLSEDASFFSTVQLPDEIDQTLRKFTYLGVADGVGSWREYGVDPRDFSHQLMEECMNVLDEAETAALEQLGSDVVVKPPMGRNQRHVMISPAQLMAQAYERVKAQNIIGSTTACVALFDSLRHQFHFSNLGDSGLIVLRHIDSDVAGSLKRNRLIPRSERQSDLQIAFVSQQQLKSFNHPYQLGWLGDEETNRDAVSFRSPNESCTSSVHIRRGDIIIMATDGLFDNVELDDVRNVALEWEQKHGFIRGGDIAQRERRWAMGNSLTIQSQEHIQELAQSLVNLARENSMDSSKDSPFALLAKDNDIMWSGGMPDDTVVLALHIVGRAADDIMEQTNQ